MTLSTDIVIAEPVSVTDLWDFLVKLVSTGHDREVLVDPPEVGSSPWNQGTEIRCTKGGQGLPAWTWLHSAIDGPMESYCAEDIAEIQEEDPDWRSPRYNQHLLRIDFDTGYSYRGPNGGGCSDLHAWFAREVFIWLAERGVTKVQWKNEFTGEWHDPFEIHVLGDPERGSLVHND